MEPHEQSGRYKLNSTSSVYSHNPEHADDASSTQNLFRAEEVGGSHSSGSSSSFAEQTPGVPHGPPNAPGPGGNDLQSQILPALKFAKRFIPIVLLLAVKVLFDHRIGIMLSIGMYLVFLYADKRFQDLVARRNVTQQQKWTLTLFLWVVLSSSAFGVYWVFADQQLQRRYVITSLDLA